MSKKVFFIIFSFIFILLGCNNLLNSKNSTDISINLDFSKNNKISRDDIEYDDEDDFDYDDCVLKVSIYNTHNFTLSNLDENKITLITQSQVPIENNVVKVKLEDIPIGINAIVFAELFYEDDEILSLIYSGKSEIFKVKNSNNKVSLILKKVSLDIEPDDETNAETPTIITQPESSIITVTDSVINNKQTLSCTARVSDGGTLSFAWYIKNNDIDEYYLSTNRTEITNNDDGSITSKLIDFEAQKDQIFYVYCEITNTNNSVNGEKTATIESNIITFACLQGTLTSISASYEENGYQLFSDELDYSKVKVIETYTSSYNSMEPTITVPADSSRYIISKTNDSISAIGYVPYTVIIIIHLPI